MYIYQLWAFALMRDTTCFWGLTSRLRTARKQPLLSSEGSKIKKKSFFCRPSSSLNMLNGDRLKLEKKQTIKVLKINLGSRLHKKMCIKTVVLVKMACFSHSSLKQC